MANAPNQIARAIQARKPTTSTFTGRVWSFNIVDGVTTMVVKVAGGALVSDVKWISSFTPQFDDIVTVSRDSRGLVAMGKIGVTADPSTDTGDAELYKLPRLDMVPTFTGTWRGRWLTAVDNECRFGRAGSDQIMGCAYYGRVIQGSELFGSDSYFLSIVRLLSPGHQPAQVRIGLLAGQGPTETGPQVLDTLDVALGPMPTQPEAESLSIQFQGWETSFVNGTAGGLALMHQPAEPDHLTRVAGTYGCSMTVTGYPAWVL